MKWNAESQRGEYYYHPTHKKVNGWNPLLCPAVKNHLSLFMNSQIIRIREEFLMMPSWGHFLLHLMTIWKRDFFWHENWTSSPCQNLSGQISATRVVFNWRKKFKHMWISPTALGYLWPNPLRVKLEEKRLLDRTWISKVPPRPCLVTQKTVFKETLIGKIWLF